MKLHQIIEQHWQKPNPILRFWLSPFAKIFAKIVAKRRQQYLSGSLIAHQLPIPVVVIGNIHAGGTGKTPITATLITELQMRGIKVGIISRGYGRKSHDIHILQPDSDANQAGDEPLMLYRQTHAPCAVGTNRYETAIALLAQYPDLQMIISDDGLQHYALKRDVEIAVFPAADVGRDDLDMLPNGGLREPLSRLNDVDFIIISDINAHALTHITSTFRQPEKVFTSTSQPSAPYRFQSPHDTLFANQLQSSDTCVAIAGIARPERFFNTLKALNFPIQQTHTLADHATIDLNQLPPSDYLFITEKDAVKLPVNTPNHVWVLPIRAKIQPDLVSVLLTKIAV